MRPLLLWLAIVAAALPFAAHAAGMPPNVLLVVSEDNGPQLGCYGDPYARTPHLDALAAEGIRFRNAFVPQAGCSQSRASFLTGLYPHQHGQIGLATWGFSLYRADTPNVVRSLKGAGYRTGIIGKLHVNPEAAFPFDVQESAKGNFSRRGLRDYARQAEAFFGAGEAPFFLSVNYPDAHDPWLRQVDGLPAQPQEGGDVRAMPFMGVDPPGMREMVADYYNSLARLDALVGDLLAALERSGKARSTIVIYLGDHGADMLRGKRTCYDGGLRIPLLVRWPGRVRPQVRDELVSTIDIMPTVLAAAGAAQVPGLPGRDWEPLFSGGSPAWRQQLFAEYHTHAATNYFPQRAVRTARFKLIESLPAGERHPDFEPTLDKLEKDAGRRGVAGGLDLRAAIAAAAPEVRTAYARLQRPPRYELFDLEADPYEFRDLADDPAHAATLAELKARLDDWRRETSDPLLDEANLRRLTAEVRARAASSKGENKDTPWDYPHYFFGAPAAGAAVPGQDAKRRRR